MKIISNKCTLQKTYPDSITQTIRDFGLKKMRLATKNELEFEIKCNILKIEHDDCDIKCISTIFMQNNTIKSIYSFQRLNNLWVFSELNSLLSMPNEFFLMFIMD